MIENTYLIVETTRNQTEANGESAIIKHTGLKFINGQEANDRITCVHTTYNALCMCKHRYHDPTLKHTYRATIMIDFS